jgi:nucleotide-binding universal stress UspA family protein
MSVAAILLAVEMADDDRRLLEVGERYAKAFGARLYLIHVVPAAPAFVGLPKTLEATRRPARAAAVEVGYAYDRRAAAERARAEHEALHAWRERLEAAGVATTALLIEGAAAEKIAAEASRLGCGLIIIGTHHRRLLERSVHGSTAQELLRDAPCPVLIVPTGSA